MNIEEYNSIKDFNYLQYCDYLQEKYGIGKCDYMTKTYNKKAGFSRTSEGLFVHHKYEDHAINLSKKEYASKNPFEWQKANNLVYCDYLEHLYLHILICENPSIDANAGEAVGIGGVINFIVPLLNDFYSGWRTKQIWEEKCLNKISNDIDVYFELIKRFKHTCSNNVLYSDECLYSSANDKFGLWDKNNNKEIFDKIKEL